MTDRRLLMMVVAVSMLAGCSAASSGSPQADLRQSCLRDDVQKATAAISRGADTKSADTAGWTPLHDAAAHGSVGVIKVLVAHGAPIDAQTARGQTPLMEAIIKGQAGAVEALLAAGAATTLKSDRGQTASQYAETFPNAAISAALSKSRTSRP